MQFTDENTTARRRCRGGQVLVDGDLVRADLVVDGGLIAEVVFDPPPGELGDRDCDVDVDCGGLVIAPGFIDLQRNGAVGVDITNEPDRTVIAGATAWDRS